jgi:hypothetical protein
VIYFIQSGDSEFVKIGYCAGEARARLGQLQVGNPLPLRLVSVKEGGKNIEALLHDRFEHLRVRGEWFKWDAELRDFARPFIDGEPSDLLKLRREYARDVVAGRPLANPEYAKIFNRSPQPCVNAQQ